MIESVLWRTGEVVAATGGRATGDWQATGVSIDSRTVEPGDLFVAIEGPTFDGHDFVAQAFEKGAVAAMVHREVEADGPVLVVPDTLQGLERLGRAARARCRARVVAITGSVGKTGTKEALRHVLGDQGITHASASSLNNHWGVPLSLARLPIGAAYAVLEIGMNAPGEIARLVELVRPHVAVVTAVEQAHMMSFDDLSQVATAKAEIFLGLEPGGTAVVNRDGSAFGQLEQAARDAGIVKVVSFGADARADARLVGLALHPSCTCVSAEICGIPMTYKVGAPGRHWGINSLAVLAVVHVLGADLARAGLALAEFRAPAGRGRRESVQMGTGSLEVIDESYNANPASMRAALEVLGLTEPKPGGRRIAVLGDMRELGEGADEMHRGLLPDILSNWVDLVFACGPHMAELYRLLPPNRRGGYAQTSDQLVPVVDAAVRAGDVVMIKGSLGTRMAPIVAMLRAPRPAPALAVNG